MWLQEQFRRRRLHNHLLQRFLWERPPSLRVICASHVAQLFVRTLTGATITMYCDLTVDTVDDLKTDICIRVGIPVEQQRLIFAGTQVEDGRTLGYYKTGNLSGLDLVLRYVARHCT